LRAANSIADLLALGDSNGWSPAYTNVVGGDGSNDVTADFSAASGPSQSNALFYQYRVDFVSSNCVVPVLTNVTIVFSNRTITSVAVRAPSLAPTNQTIPTNLQIVSSLTQIIMYLSNFYDPYTTAIYAVDRLTGNKIALSIVYMDNAPYSQVRKVIADIYLPFGANYDLVISNQGNANAIVIPDFLHYGISPPNPIGLQYVAKAYTPTNNTITIPIYFDTAGTLKATLDLYDVSGRLIHKIVQNNVGPGICNFVWNPGKKIPMGICLYVVTAESQSGQMMRRGSFVIVK
jgi:hypothetical protein